MDELIRSVSALKRGAVGRLVCKQTATFRKLGRSGIREIFKELCFCILTANYTAQGGIKIQKAVDNGFLALPQDALAKKLKKLGYRFPNKRAEYIVKARAKIDDLKRGLRRHPGHSMRDWLVKHVLGLGYKEASHFLRNIGYGEFAIIDFHIIDLLARHGIIRKPKSRTLTRKQYAQIERRLAKLAKECGVVQGELDLYLWYLETGKILK